MSIGPALQEHGGGASLTTEPAAGTSAATDVSLHSHLVSRIAALDRVYAAEIESVRAALAAEVELRRARREDDKQAIQKAEESVNKRLEGMNEFRAQLDRQAQTFITHTEMDAAIDRLSAMVERNRVDISERLTKESFEGTLKGWVLWRENVDKSITQLNERASSRREYTDDRRAGTSNVLAIAGTVAAALFVLLGVLNYVTTPDPVVITPTTSVVTTPTP